MTCGTRTFHICNSRSRGSITLIVVVMLFIIALMGTAYLQYVRIQRLPSIKVEGNIDTVVAAAVDQVKSALVNDLKHNSPTEISHFSPYDYPWTNQDTTLTTNIWTVSKFDGTQVQARGNQLGDDTWLAATWPAVDATTTNTNPLWSHITNLNGIYLRWNNATGNFVDSGGTDITASNIMPDQNVIDFTAGSGMQTDTSLDPLTNPNLVDADGDGIPDSRWTWAPIPQINGITYVMAVRVVDLSSLANLNVHTSPSDSAGAYDVTSLGTDAPHFDTPAELNLTEFVINPGRSGSVAELTNLLSNRFGTVINLAAPISLSSRQNHWQNTARYYPLNIGYAVAAPGTGFLYGTEDEYRLRRLNGIYDNKLTPTAIDDPLLGMPSFLQGVTSPYSNPITLANLTAQFDFGKRSNVTCYSGAMVLAPPLPGDQVSLGSYPAFKVDLNKDLVGGPWNTGNTISSRIYKVYSDSSFTPPTLLPGGFDGTTATGIQNFSDQFAACILGYRSTDNKLQKVGNYYGMEALPFMSEVYVQRAYTLSTVTPDGGIPGNFIKTWTQSGTAGFAIEIRNPFRKPISLDNVHLVVNGSDWGTLSSLTASAGYSPTNMLSVEQAIILKQDSTGGSNDVIDTTTLIDPAFPTVNIVNVPLTATTTWPHGAAPITVELKGISAVDSVTQVSYQKVTTDQPDDDVTYSTVTSPAPGSTGYVQTARIGNGDRINVLTVMPGEFAPNTHNPETAWTKDLCKLGLTDKTVGVAPYSGGIANRIAPSDGSHIVIRDEAITQPGELAQISVLGCTDTETIPEAFNAATNLDAFLINTDPTIYTMDSTSPDPKSFYHVTYGQFLIDQFTTLDPLQDTVDNDRDGNIDATAATPPSVNAEKEQIVPGLINLNTIPQALLADLLPIADPAIRANVAQAIVTYRDNATPGARPAGARGVGAAGTAKGISSLGELLNAPGIKDALTTGAYVGDTSAMSGTRVDFYCNNPAVSNTDGIIDDIKEKTLIASWLSQVGSTRSDYFVAYILVRGYGQKNGAVDFSTATGLKESKRAMVLLRRNCTSFVGKTAVNPPQIIAEAIVPGGKAFVENK